jgi:hypothetical protein
MEFAPMILKKTVEIGLEQSIASFILNLGGKHQKRTGS